MILPKRNIKKLRSHRVIYNSLCSQEGFKLRDVTKKIFFFTYELNFNVERLKDRVNRLMIYRTQRTKIH